ncbi:MAG TPA: thiamine phosphate synthase [Verrucomicrobiae bacterium]|jgi:thiamine-phosphate pyrophosphorylase|nr:thiamine phosphate synthase [Verrucomicrobiae bacterium]
MKPLEDCRLYTFVDTAYLNGRAPEVVAQQLCDGGSDIIQLRAKSCSTEEIRRTAEKIAPVTKRAGVSLVINDYPEIAREVGAGFCHLGQEDFFDAGHANVHDLKIDRLPSASTPSILKIGLSSHAPEQAQRAVEAGADYIAIGPVYATGTKPGRTPVTLEYVRWAAQNVKVPWFAIGGINLDNLDDVIAAGATRVCVVSAILNAPDLAAACREFQQHLHA